MAKRKRGIADADGLSAKSRKPEPAVNGKKTPRPDVAASKRTSKGDEATPKVNGHAEIQPEGIPISSIWAKDTTTVQVITGSYERVLHGFTATIPRTLVAGEEDPAVTFSDTFLFNAHASSIRCLALSPMPDNPNGKITLATGSTDERINVFSLSLCPPPSSSSKVKLPSLHGTSITENSKNKELGSFLHHSSSITALYFPTKAKLLSSAEDSTVAITRTRDWVALSTIKAPIPKPQGRPSGDTAGPGEVPSGINDFAVHPSQKLMLSIGKGEKCMRLWNLVTGKKAGVLNFSKDILSLGGEGRFGTGEGRRVVWDPEGEEFAVGFERGIVVFGIDCKVKTYINPTPRTKLHQIHYLPGRTGGNVLAVSTEDGRIMFYDTRKSAKDEEEEDEDEDEDEDDDEATPATLIAQVGGPATGITTRVKDFEIFPIPQEDGTPNKYLIIAGSSDGAIRLWLISSSELTTTAPEPAPQPEDDTTAQTGFAAKQVGSVLGTYSTGTRITCLKAFIMTGEPDKAGQGDDDEEEKEDHHGEDSASSSSEDDGEE